MMIREPKDKMFALPNKCQLLSQDTYMCIIWLMIFITIHQALFSYPLVIN